MKNNISDIKNRVWDIPVRIVHMGFMVLIPACWWTAENDRMDWHRWCAYILLGFLLFRIFWGFAGSDTARFKYFLRGPSSTWRYLRTLTKRGQAPSFGHNPLGALSVIALLGLMCLQVVLGLFSIDVDGWEEGPFAAMLSFDTARSFAEWHELIFNVLVGFIALHIFAIFYYWVWRKQQLIGAMIHGRTPFENTTNTVVRNNWTAVLIGAVLSALPVMYLFFRAV